MGTTPSGSSSPGSGESSGGWWRRIGPSGQVAIVTAALGSGVLTAVVTGGFGLINNKSAAPSPKPAPVVVSSKDSPSASTAVATCPGESERDRHVQQVPNAPATGLTFCPVDVNSGKPLTGVTYTVSGTVLGAVPTGRMLLVIE
jgi:hypothetical protein